MSPPSFKPILIFITASLCSVPESKASPKVRALIDFGQPPPPQGSISCIVDTTLSSKDSRLIETKVDLDIKKWGTFS